MAIPITIPRLGWNMDEGVFVGWLKQDGDHIRAGEALFSLEGEKATEEIECLDEGILRIAPSAPKAGETIPVGVVIGYLVREGEDAPFGEPGASATGGSEALAGSSLPPVADAPGSPESAAPVSRKTLAISPRARRVAAQLGIDPATLRGSGRTGRIRERDVRAAVPVRPIRKTIAERMVASHLTTAPVTLTTTADATTLVKLRNQFKADNDLVPSYTDFLVKLSAAALQQHPALNARWTDGQIILSPAIHIGIAVDTDAGLLVPVIRDVPALSLEQLSARSRELIERARQRRLSVEEMQDGTFTVTNLGAFGIEAFTPIINHPECAILGVGRIQKQPVVIGDGIAIRDMIALSLTFDHRIVDGAPAARFLQTLTRLIEHSV